MPLPAWTDSSMVQPGPAPRTELPRAARSDGYLAAAELPGGNSHRMRPRAGDGRLIKDHLEALQERQR